MALCSSSGIFPSPGTAEHILLVGRNGILDVDIYNVRAESIPAFGGILAALYKVCKVECGLEVCAVQRLHQVNTAGKNITIDILLVFVHQDHVVLFSNGNELAQLLDDSVTIVGRILPSGIKKLNMRMYLQFRTLAISHSVSN